MAPTMPPASPSVLVASSDRIGPRLAAVVKDALLRHYGSVKAAAISLDVDASLLMRELETGRFRLERLEGCDPAAKAFVCRALHDAFGDADPQARVQRLIRESRRILDELAEAVA
jgi:hypothetical protein